VNAILNLALVRVMGYRGLALGTSIAALCNAVLLIVLLRRSLGGIEGTRMISSLGRIAVASLVMGVVCVGVDAAAMRWLPGQGLGPQILRLTLTIAASLLSLAAAAHALHIREFRESVALVSRRLRRTAP
jgi:putative peptidoglycan lipid II flippase